MRLNTTELSCYERDGFVLTDAFAAGEVALLKAQMPALLAEDSPRRVLEKDGRTVRALHGVHTTNDVFARLVRDPRLLEPARQILGSEVYVHQFKINIKAAFEGDVWKWHQDFIFWLKQDGMEEPRAVNAMVFLDPVTEFNGPLYLIPGSQRAGMIDVAAHASTGWQSSFAADLKYSIPRDTLEGLVASDGITAPKGDAGSVLFTHCNLVHGSPPNMSPFDRMLVIVTYNSVDNTLRPVPEPRPEFLVSRDFSPLVPVDGPLTGPPPGR